MPLSNNRVKIIVVGVIGVSAIVIYFYRKCRTSKEHIEAKHLNETFISGLNSNFNHFSDLKLKTFKSVGIGRSEVTTSISSKNSVSKEIENENIREDFTDNGNYGRLGIKSLDEVINHLELSIAKLEKYDENHITYESQSDSHLLFNEMKHLLESAYRIREKYKQKLIITSSSYVGSDTDSSSNDSFVSAKEYYQDDSIIDVYMESTIKENKYLLKEALIELENSNVYYRTIRSELVDCPNDTEYIAKLYCLRAGFQTLCDNKDSVKELEEIGLEVGCAILFSLGYETDSFQNSYHQMILFLHSSISFHTIQEELIDKGIEIVSLYDILFDFVLLDALESLENPPSSLVSVINNRWLSEGFKKTTLNSSIWTILLAKRKFLKFKSGFKAHFYDIMDAIGAPLAWSFLGSDPQANQIASTFKDSLYNLIRYLYSDSPRFTTREELAEDIMGKLRSLKEILVNHLALIIDKPLNSVLDIHPI